MGESSILVFRNNSAHQGGAVYLQYVTGMDVCNNSRVHFYYSSAEQYGGAIYADNQVCIFSFHTYSSKVIFEENIAKERVDMHVYVASIKDETCMHSLCMLA